MKSSTIFLSAIAFLAAASVNAGDCEGEQKVIALL